ncbi:hypothetical protein [Plesiomonas shigelloides]|uniref:hypothetical protein n=1 Tax=Plesiomonas shigelloides TaxID=703 RepID=UPI0031B77C5D
MKLNNRSLSLFFIAVYLFICTAESLPESRYYFALAFLAAAVIFNGKVTLRKKTVTTFLYFFLFIVTITIIGAMDILTYKSNINYPANIAIVNLTSKLILCFAIFIVINNENELYHVLGILIIIHSFIFAVQFFSIYTTKHYIDIVYFFSDETSRYGGGFSIPWIGNIYRVTGIYVEPSTYSGFVFTYITIRYFLSNTLEKKDQFALSTCILSLSIASIIYCSLLLLVLFLKKKEITPNRILMTTITFTLLPIAAYFIIDIITSRISYTDGSAIYLRENLFDIVFIKQTLSEILIGNGLLGYPTIIANFLNQGGLWQAQLAALNDNGIWLFIIMKFGLIGLLAITFVLFRNTNNISSFLVLSLVLFTKISIMNYTFILFSTIILMFPQFNKNIKVKV